MIDTTYNHALVGDGVHDDTDALQERLDAASTHLEYNHGGRVELPPGYYKHTRTLRTLGGVGIRGQNARAATVLSMQGDGPQLVVDCPPALAGGVAGWFGAEDVRFEREAGQGPGLELVNTYHADLTRVWVRGHQGPQVSLIEGYYKPTKRSERATLKDCILQAGAGGGLWINGGYDLDVIRCQLNAVRYGISASGVSGLRVTGGGCGTPHTGVAVALDGGENIAISHFDIERAAGGQHPLRERWTENIATGYDAQNELRTDATTHNLTLLDVNFDPADWAHCLHLRRTRGWRAIGCHFQYAEGLRRVGVELDGLDYFTHDSGGQLIGSVWGSGTSPEAVFPKSLLLDDGYAVRVRNEAHARLQMFDAEHVHLVGSDDPGEPVLSISRCDRVMHPTWTIDSYGRVLTGSGLVEPN